MTKNAPILTIDAIARRVKKRNREIILIGGTFDVFHIGHVKFLEKAKKLGGILVVGVTADHLVRNRKGGERPYMNEIERADLISRLRCVDYVFISQQADWLEAGYLKKLNPDIFVIGKDAETQERNREIRKNLRLHFPQLKMVEISRFIGRSTTNIAAQIKQDQKNTHKSGFQIGSETEK